jgi:hypothetical protein
MGHRRGVTGWHALVEALQPEPKMPPCSARSSTRRCRGGLRPCSTAPARGGLPPPRSGRRDGPPSVELQDGRSCRPAPRCQLPRPVGQRAQIAQPLQPPFRNGMDGPRFRHHSARCENHDHRGTVRDGDYDHRPRLGKVLVSGARRRRAGPAGAAQEAGTRQGARVLRRLAAVPGRHGILRQRASLGPRADQARAWLEAALPTG